MHRNIEELSNQEYDLAIIGGGITGAWIAFHGAQQGYKVALIERGDFACATSSASSKLLHGGIRYLQQFQFDKVRESAMERAEYLYAAPHLSNAVPFVVPTYPDFKRSKFFLNCGMLAYDFLCMGQNRVIGNPAEYLPKTYSLSATDLNKLFDISHEPHTGAVVFYERHMLDSERMVWAILDSARELGARVYNYVSAEHYLSDDTKVLGVKARDEISGQDIELKAKLVINAAGPFIDNLNKDLPKSKSAPKINGYAVGSHIVTRKISDHAIALTTKHKSNAKVDRGGRHVFVIPWRNHSLIGTSYDEIETPNGDISLQSEHVEELLEAVNDNMPNAKLTRDDIVSGYSGLYPLHTENIQSTVYQGSGEYQLIDHETANGLSGLITALGAKYTTGRKISELTLKLVNKRFERSSKPQRSKLSSANYTDFGEFVKQKMEQLKDKFEPPVIDHLACTYGSKLDDFVDFIGTDESLSKPICDAQPDILGQVAWAIEKEQALTIDDVLYRRTSLGLLGLPSQSLGAIADLMATELTWDEARKQDELRHSLDRLNRTRSAIKGIANE